MKFFDFFKKISRDNLVFIKKNNLKNWWQENFSEKERKIIISESKYLLENDNSKQGRTSARTLYLIAGNVITRFHNQNLEIVIRILKKAAKLSNDKEEKSEIYSQLIELYLEEENRNLKFNKADLVKKAERENWDGELKTLLN